MKITLEQKLIAESNGISLSLVHNRVKRSGWEIERAITEKPMTEEEKHANNKEIRKSERANYWSSDGNTMVRCPVEGCMHVGDIITKAHCRLQHGMEREEVKKQYGMPYKVQVNGSVKFLNLNA